MNNARLLQILDLIAETPQNEFLYCAAALEYQSLGEWALSIEYFEKLRSINSSYLGLYYPLAVLYHSRGMQDQAMDCLYSGMEVAKNQANQKTYREMNELLNILSSNPA